MVKLSPQQTTICPVCSKKGKRVGPATIHALLKPEFALKFSDEPAITCCSAEQVKGCSQPSTETGWRFCDSKDCNVVYFSDESDLQFVKSQLSVQVGIKERSGERPLCYCFGHSVASIKEEIRTKGHSDAPEVIRKQMKDPGCKCETENPSGTCCLGSVAKGIQIAREELK